MKSKALLFAGLLVTSLVCSGCVVAMGNDTGPNPRSANVSLGQELMDLKKALDSGAITQSEYDSQKAKLLHAKHKD